MEMLKSNEKIPNHILCAVEDYWGFGLPKDYRNFLLEHNGGVPKKTLFDFKNGEEGSVIQSFFGIVVDYDNLLKNICYSGDRFPENMAPIARDTFGNMILITVKGKDRNKIYFWDHELESEEDEQPDYSNLTLIANNFTEFVNNLREDVDNEDI